MLREFLTFQPIYQERVWGGRALATALGRTLPPDRPIGESWEIVDRPEAQSVVAAGALTGQTLRAAIAGHAGDLMGPSWPGSQPFPLLVKWLDCRERLSLQVHPPAALASELGGEPKTENWYIADTAQGAQLIVGLRRGVSRAQFERAIADQTLEDCVHRFPVAVGDSILVRSGEIHAIDGGSLILEIQQNSDTTYRVYDWGRMGLDGKPRTLHQAQSLRSIDWDAFEPAPVRAAPTSGLIADCDEFSIRRVVLDPGEELKIAAGEQPRILSVVQGRVSAARAEKRLLLARGANVLVPYAVPVSATADGAAIVLLTEGFT